MCSKTMPRNEFAVASGEAGNSLKERTTLEQQHFVFGKLRRTKSMPKRGPNERPKLNATLPEPTQPKVDYFKGFNRAKARLFHSCRLSKSEKSEKSSRNLTSNCFTSDSFHPRLSSRPSIISETDTIASSLSFDGEDDGKEADSHHTYEHPMIAELESEMTVPPPPPRACPAWLKSALEKSQHTSGSPRPERAQTPVDIASLAASYYSEDGSFLNHFDEDEDNVYEDVRIYPVLQNGVKVSDTHYWVINPPKSRSRRLADTKVGPHCRPTCLSGKLLDEERSHYANLPDTSPCSSPDTNTQSEDFHASKLRRGRSECNKEALRLIQQTLVEKLHFQVPTARVDECRAVLIGSSWNFQKAQRRLKVELLCRMGCASKSACEKLLERMNWNFESAADFIRDGGNPRQIYSISLPRTPLTSTASSTDNSANVTPNESPDIVYLNTAYPPLL